MAPLTRGGRRPMLGAIALSLSLGWRVVRSPAALVLEQPLAAASLVRLALSR